MTDRRKGTHYIPKKSQFKYFIDEIEHRFSITKYFIYMSIAREEMRPYIYKIPLSDNKKLKELFNHLVFNLWEDTEEETIVCKKLKQLIIANAEIKNIV